MSVAVLTPIKDCAYWLPRFLQQIEKLELIERIIFIYGESQIVFDNTLEIVKHWTDNNPKLQVEIYHEPPMGALSSAGIGVLYQDFQKIIENGDEKHVFMVDSDVIGIPPKTVVNLKRRRKAIIAPYPWVIFHDRPGPLFFDTFVFRTLEGHRFHPFKPPLNDGRLFEVGSVGTAMLVTRKCFLATEYSDPYPHMKFCNESREKGYKVWADPTNSVLHIDVTRMAAPYNRPHEELAAKQARLRGAPDEEIYALLDHTPFVKDDGTTVNMQQLGVDYARAYIWGVIS